MLSLIPKPPKSDFVKLMKKDKMVLRFIVRMIDGEGYELTPADYDSK